MMNTGKRGIGRASRARCVWGAVLIVAWFGGPLAGRADLIELLSGAKLQGTVTKIDKEAREVSVTTTMGGRDYLRVYPYDRIHAVTLGDHRYVLNEMPAAEPAGRRPDRSSATSGDPAPVSRTTSRGASSDVAQHIAQEGSTPPPWYEATPLNYPSGLDLSWPEPAPGGWNNQKNVGQYVWDVINPNPGKWQEGTRLMHHLLVVNQDKPEVAQRVMNSLGRSYHNLVQDYARAAFWWQKAGVDKPDTRFPASAPLLAECYYRLGSKPMAVELLRRLEKTAPQFALIKVWADLGETQHALQLAESYARGTPAVSAIAYMYAGDACRVSGEYSRAMEYYQKVLDAPASGQYAQKIEHEKRRARASLEAIRLFEMADATRVPDGVYEANSMGYNGLVHVAVSVQAGRITSVQIKRHEEKQFYSAFTDTTAKIVQRQGLKGVDATSAATITSEAVINATAKALAGAVRAR